MLLHVLLNFAVYNVSWCIKFAYLTRNCSDFHVYLWKSVGTTKSAFWTNFHLWNLPCGFWMFHVKVLPMQFSQPARTLSQWVSDFVLTSDLFHLGHGLPGWWWDRPIFLRTINSGDGSQVESQTNCNLSLIFSKFYRSEVKVFFTNHLFQLINSSVWLEVKRVLFALLDIVACAHRFVISPWCSPGLHPGSLQKCPIHFALHMRIFDIFG